MKDFFKSLGFKVLAVVALFLVGIMIYAASTGGAATIPDTIIGAIVTPLQSLGAAISNGVSGLFGGFGGSAELREQNAALQEEINRLRQNQVELDETRRQLELYRQFLELKEANPDYQFADARVVAADPAGRFYNFTINSGSLKGVKNGDPVITPAGLVGVVYDVTLNSAKVRTILDPSTNVGAYISRSGDDGTTTGSVVLAQQGLLRVDYLSREAGTAVGDYVVTSGRGGVYPKGLLIGSIQSVEPDTDGMTLTAKIKPFADIKNVIDVFVITDFAEKGGGE